MKSNLISVDSPEKWGDVLKHFPVVDVCSTPEYHRLYDTRSAGGKSYIWHINDGEKCFAYPFVLTPVTLSSESTKIETKFFDISSTYGYGGPLSNTADKDFIRNAWQAFDEWASATKVVAEFTRFSVFTRSHELAHPDCKVAFNRRVAVSALPDKSDDILMSLPSKTRNMIRKALKIGFEAKELELERGLRDFRTLYEETMKRNNAPSFFLYDDAYYDLLSDFPEGAVRLFGVFAGADMVSSAIALTYKNNALYHLGASLSDYSRLGAGNLGLYTMTCALRESGVRFLNVGGGRTTADHDALLRFKKSNAFAVDDYRIGQRVLLQQDYDALVDQWMDMTGQVQKPTRLIFYR
ncbi:MULTISPECIES: GNAT family N-acetyltransferase [Thalassospira]|jgi:hypothetical protein|uniref:GNAT family N-acetyltransferase n=1 Tax=Thalassospira TaxID=168934 RepID=UPI0007A5D0FB|nr:MULTISPECIES: GNAT family N-acetyltransferase [unclassified Thalassospira]KZC99061.1 hypothetical protein AUQ41_11070 [Thalassospira sp. MCCC 1A02898]ONH88643.1 hypothetical protein TH47_01525 [Thalassospira sp. MCCC 1A02803]BDW90349.1 hypothetical protein MACH01_31160 [Thalassospira tepidiphila]